MNFGRNKPQAGKKPNFITRTVGKHLSPISSSWQSSRQFIEALKQTKSRIEQESQAHYTKNKEEIQKLAPPDLFRFNVLKQIETMPEGLNQSNLNQVNQALRIKAYTLYGQTSLLMAFLMLAIVIGGVVFVMNIHKSFWWMILLQYILSIVVFSQVYYSVRFQTWCLLRKVSGLSFVQWLKKGYYKDRIDPDGADLTLGDNLMSLLYLMQDLFKPERIKGIMSSISQAIGRTARKIFKVFYKGVSLADKMEIPPAIPLQDDLPANELFKDLTLIELTSLKERLQATMPEQSFIPSTPD